MRDLEDTSIKPNIYIIEISQRQGKENNRQWKKIIKEIRKYTTELRI